MLKILEQASAAQDLENWSLVNQYLQQLKENGTSTPHLKETESELALNLALQVLSFSDFQHRWEVAKIFPLFGKSAIAPLLEILEDPFADIETRWFVARILGQFDDAEVIISLVNLLQSTVDEELSSMVAQALANIGNSAIEAITSLLKDEKTRLLGVRSLGHIRRREIIEPLLTVVKDPSPEIRSIAIEALGSFHDRSINKLLIEALKDTAARVRKEAAIALGFRSQLSSELDLVNNLKPLLYDLDPEVCQQAAYSLGRMGNDDAATALFDVLSSPATPVELKLDIVRALSWIETPQTLEYLKSALGWASVEVCLEIVTVLGRSMSQELKPKATQILLNFLHSAKTTATEPQIKQALAMSLGELGSSDAIAPLLDLTLDSEESVRLHAAAALKKLSASNLILSSAGRASE